MSRKKKTVSPFFKISLIAFLLSLIAVFMCAANERFRKSFLSAGAFLRTIPISVSNLVPVSVFEIIIYSSPLLIFFLIVYCLRGFSDRRERRRRLLNFTAILLLFLSVYFSSFAIGYFKEGAREAASFDELVSAAEKLNDKLLCGEKKELCELDLAGEKIYNSYLEINEDALSVLSISPRPKEIKSQYLFTKLGILGMYSFISSEILINPGAPEYTKAFTVAHEMAHAFGVAREDEASFYAYLSLKESGDDSLEYSAEIYALQSILSEIYRISPKDYFRIYSTLPEYVKSEFKLYREFYSDGIVTEISERVNDKLISTFDKEGAESYSCFASLVAKEINKTG